MSFALTDDRRRHRPEHARLHRPRHPRRGHRHRDRLRPPRPRRLLRRRLPRHERLRPRRRRLRRGGERPAAGSPCRIPTPFPDDCRGHGTHVAGIIGANGAVTRRRSDVTFGAYRVFGCNGRDGDRRDPRRDGARLSRRRRRAEHEHRRGPQRLAAVAGGAGGLAPRAQGHRRRRGGGQRPPRRACTRWARRASARNVIAAASVDNLVRYRRAFAITPDNRRVLVLAGDSARRRSRPARTTLARTGTPTTPDDACAPLPAGSLAGKVALVRRGGCNGIDKGINVAAAGAIAVVVYNNAGPAFGSTGGARRRRSRSRSSTRRTAS